MASAETSHMATLQPSATSWRASSRPMPVPPPVITAIFPAKSFMGIPRPFLLISRRCAVASHGDCIRLIGVATRCGGRGVQRQRHGGPNLGSFCQIADSVRGPAHPPFDHESPSRACGAAAPERVVSREVKLEPHCFSYLKLGSFCQNPISLP